MRHRIPWSVPALCALLAAWAAWAEAGPGTALLGVLRFPRAADRLAPAVPAVLAAPPREMTRGVSAPWRVGIQAGHWKIADLPEEQSRLRGDTGSRWGQLREVDLNVRIAEIVAADLRSAGVTVDLLPATVPAGYEADAFVSIHADGGGGTSVSGWKVAAPRRSSLAARLLRDEISRAYGSTTALAEDRYGVTYNMRGYYAFSWTRYHHAVSPSTPAAIIETGYITSPQDRRIIMEEPGKAALGISMGILAYLGLRPGLDPAALVPLAYPPMIVATDNATVRFFPDETERIAARLPAGTRVRPVDERDGWVELTVQGNFRISGWMKTADLVVTGS